MKQKTLHVALLATVLTSLSAPGLNAQAIQSYAATSENTRILGPNELLAQGHEMAGRGEVQFLGISDGQIFGTIDTHLNPTLTPNSQRGSVIYDPATLDHTFISRVPAGSSSVDYYQVLDMDGGLMLASYNGQNYYHTAAEGYTQLAMPSWVTGSFRSMTAHSLSGQYIVGSTSYFDSGWHYNGFIYDTLADSYLSILPADALSISIRGIDGNTVIGDYAYLAEGGGYGNRYFTYDIGSGIYTDLSLNPEQLSIAGITGDIVYGASDNTAAYYDLSSGTLTLLDFSAQDFPDPYQSSSITGMEGNMIIGNLSGVEASTGFIIAVPEPSGTFLVGVASLLGILLRRRARA